MKLSSFFQSISKNLVSKLLSKQKCVLRFLLLLYCVLVQFFQLFVQQSSCLKQRSCIINRIIINSPVGSGVEAMKTVRYRLI